MLNRAVRYLSVAILATGSVLAAEETGPIAWRLEPVKSIKGCKVPE
ncbi:MAG: hypothetical protein RBT84_17695 [FCB group bacterium]|jgi:hypothetical protein|nr:hypothetical protein [FCB group bacterium]